MSVPTWWYGVVTRSDASPALRELSCYNIYETSANTTIDFVVCQNVFFKEHSVNWSNEYKLLTMMEGNSIRL